MNVKNTTHLIAMMFRLQHDFTELNVGDHPETLPWASPGTNNIVTGVCIHLQYTPLVQVVKVRFQVVPLVRVMKHGSLLLPLVLLVQLVNKILLYKLTWSVYWLNCILLRNGPTQVIRVVRVVQLVKLHLINELCLIKGPSHAFLQGTNENKTALKTRIIRDL